MCPRTREINTWFIRVHHFLCPRQHWVLESKSMLSSEILHINVRTLTWTLNVWPPNLNQFIFDLKWVFVLWVWNFIGKILIFQTCTVCYNNKQHQHLLHQKVFNSIMYFIVEVYCRNRKKSSVALSFPNNKSLSDEWQLQHRHEYMWCNWHVPEVPFQS